MSPDNDNDVNASKGLKQHPYGYCPRCAAPGYSRERRPNGNDTCEVGHTYPSAAALAERPGLLGTKPAPAAVTVLQRGELTPQQILAGTLHDPDFKDIANVIVICQHKDGGDVFINHSNMTHADLAYCLLQLDKDVKAKL